MKNTSPLTDTTDTGETEILEPVRKQRPPIIEEEDQVFEQDPSISGNPDNMKVSKIAESEQKHKYDMENFRNRVSVALLIACFFMIFVFAMWDSCKKVDSTLFTGAFEFAKIVATTVLGYLFASNTKEK